MSCRIRASTICINDGRYLVVQLRDPHSGARYLLPPGGEVETGETPEQAAVRETLEETGYQVQALQGSECIVQYSFLWSGVQHECQTHFFLAHLKDAKSASNSMTPTRPLSLEKYHEGHAWITRTALEEELEFHPKLRKAILDMVDSH